MANSKSLKFYNHNYELLQHGDAEYHISLRRTQRLHRFNAMKQPVPAGAIMGLDLMLNIKRFGKPASNYLIYIYYKDGRVLHKGQLDENGYLDEIKLPIDAKCKCVPIGLSNTDEQCDEQIDQYELVIIRPEVSSLAFSAL